MCLPRLLMGYTGHIVLAATLPWPVGPSCRQRAWRPQSTPGDFSAAIPSPATAGSGRALAVTAHGRDARATSRGMAVPVSWRAGRPWRITGCPPMRRRARRRGLDNKCRSFGPPTARALRMTSDGARMVEGMAGDTRGRCFCAHAGGSRAGSVKGSIKEAGLVMKGGASVG